MLIYFEESGIEKLNRIKDIAKQLEVKIETVELPAQLYLEFVMEYRKTLKIDKESININSVPNCVDHDGVKIKRTEKGIPFYVLDNYLSSHLQDITKDIEVKTLDQIENKLIHKIKTIFSEGKVILSINATPDEYLLFRQAKDFTIKFEYLKFKNNNWHPKKGDKYFPEVGGQKITVNII